MSLYWIPATDKTYQFPPVEDALQEPNGLLAAGGDLSPDRLMNAYRNGIFPWFSEGEPILWWSPNPRTVIFPAHLKISHSLRKTLRKSGFRVTLDTQFKQVMEACAAPRQPETGTWINAEIITAYCRLYEMGIAHSVEVWKGHELVGGLYGLAIGRVFFGESMFSRATDASKVGLVYLVRQLERWGYTVIDGQVSSPHLYTLGAEDISRTAFITLLDNHCDAQGRAKTKSSASAVEDTNTWMQKAGPFKEQLPRIPGAGDVLPNPPGPWQLDADLT